MAGYKKALARFEEAVRAHAFIGTQPPGEWAEIEAEYEEAKRALITKLQYRQLAAEERVRAELKTRQSNK